MSDGAPPDEPEARRPSSHDDTRRAIGAAALGGTFAYLVLVGLCQLLALVGYLVVGAYGLWSWMKVGLLTASVALRAEVVATMRGAPVFPTPIGPTTFHWRFVPMLLTISFLGLAARAGRRAARERRGCSALVTTALAAAGAGIPVAALGAIAGSLVTLSFPELGLIIRPGVGSAALWSGIVAATGSGTGAYLEAAQGRAAAAALRGGLAAVGWALGLVAAAVLVLAALEPDVTRGYVDGLRGLGAGGGLLFGYHLLAFPAQSALLLVPASGSCLEIVGEGSAFDLCPWSVVVSGPMGALFLTDRLLLSPWLWMVNAVPGVAAFVGGERAASGSARRAAIARGAIAGVVFGLLGTVGAVFAAPRLTVPFFPLDVRVPIAGTLVVELLWGIVGGTLGGWFAARRYGELELPRPTSV